MTDVMRRNLLMMRREAKRERFDPISEEGVCVSQMPVKRRESFSLDVDFDARHARVWKY
jgi:hypothetical protein